MNKRALGRGLNTLLPNRPSGAPPADPSPPQTLSELPVTRLNPNPFQPRKQFDERALAELAQSIKSDGVIQPIVVRQAGGVYEIVAGERRWRAAQIAGLTTVPVHIQKMPDERMLEVALVENIQREDLNPIEEAEAFHRLSEALGLSHEEIGQRTGKDRVTISNSIRLLQLPPEIRDLIVAGKLSAGHGRALLKLTEPEQMQDMAEKAVEQGWSVRQLEQCTNLHKGTQAASGRPPESAADPNVKAAVDELERVLGTRVRVVEKGKGKGRLEIDYYSPEDLDRIYSVIVSAS